MTDIAPDEAPARTGWGGNGAGPAVLLALVMFVDNVEKAVIPGIVPILQDDLGFSDTQIGLLGSAPTVAALLASLPAGRISDRVASRTRMIAITLAVWAVLASLNALVSAFALFLLVRIALGAGQAGNDPPVQSLLADYYEPGRRGKPYALLRAVGPIGIVFGLGLAAVIAEAVGWRAAFAVVVVPSLIVALLVDRMREPVRGAFDGGGASPEAEGVSAVSTVLGLLRTRSLLAITIAGGFGGAAFAGMGFWIPAFLERHTSLGTAAAAGMMALIGLVAATGGLSTGAVLTDRLRRRHVGAPLRMAAMVTLGSGVLFMAGFGVEALVVQIPVLTAATWLLLMGGPAVQATIADVVPAAKRGLGFAVPGMLGLMVGSLMPLTIGLLADQFPIVVAGETVGNLRVAFLITMPAVIFAGLGLWAGIRHVEADARAAGVTST